MVRLSFGSTTSLQQEDSKPFHKRTYSGGTLDYSGGHRHSDAAWLSCLPPVGSNHTASSTPESSETRSQSVCIPTTGGAHRHSDHLFVGNHGRGGSAHTAQRASAPGPSRKSLYTDKDKVTFVTPTTSMSHNVTAKLEQFCTEKLLQNKRRMTTLYGRQAEIYQLQKELDKVCGVGVGGGSGNDQQDSVTSFSSNSYRSLCLISGLSGEGKTALAVALQEPAERKGAFFVQGKFDLAQVGEPYSGIKAAMRQLCREISQLPNRQSINNTDSRIKTTAATTKNKTTLEDIQEAVAEKLDWELELLCQVIPELEVLREQITPEVTAGRLQKLKSIPNQFTKSLLVPPVRRRVTMEMISSKSAADADDDEQSLLFDKVNETKAHFTGAKSAGERLQFAMRKLIRVISGFVPLVFLCDDAQFADSGSLAILKGWIADDRIPSLMLIWTYRSNIVDKNHFVSKAIDEIKAVQEKRNISIETIAIRELHQADVNAMIADILDVPPEESKELTSIIYRKTLGNVFFIIQYLLSLTQKGLLKYNIGSCKWSWELEEIQSGSTATDNVVELMREKLEMSPTARKFLPLAACIGVTFDIHVLDAVIRHAATHEETRKDVTDMMKAQFNIEEDVDVASELQQLEAEGLIEAAGVSTFAFVHDKVLEGALSVIPKDKLDDLKYLMGSIILDCQEELKSKGVEQLTFLLVNLLNPRLDQVSGKKRFALMQLNWTAAEDAFVAAAFRGSGMYYQAAIKLLPEKHWESMYHESMYLYTTAAESEMCLGNYDQMEVYTDAVVQLDCPILDKIPVFRIRMDACIAKAELSRALEECLGVLDSLGFHFPRTMLTARTSFALIKVMMHKKKWDPDNFGRLRVSTNPVDEAISKAHDSLLVLCMMTWPEALPLCILLSCKHVLDRGLTRNSAIPLAWMTVIIRSVFKDFQWAKKQSEVAFSLLDKFENKEIESRVYMILNVATIHWTAPIHQSGKSTTYGYKRGLECCDMDSAFWNAQFIMESALYSGTKLALVEKDAEAYTKSELDFGMFKHAECLSSLWQLLMNLRGKSLNTTTLTGSAHNEEEALKKSEETEDLHHFSHIQKDRLFAAGIFGDFELAADIGLSHLATMEVALIGQHSNVVSRFITGMACFELARTGAGTLRKKKYLRAAKKNRRLMHQWFERGNPNAQHYALFLDAENAACKGKTDQAVSFYERAIILAGRTGYIQDHALACERLAELHLRTNDMAGARRRFMDARDRYEEWGALKKVELVEEKMNSLL